MYSLGGDTAAPSGLYARICHAFSSFILFYMSGIERTNSNDAVHIYVRT